MSSEKELSRKNLLVNAGKLTVGATIGSMMVSSCAKQSVGTFKYKKLDVKEVGDLAYKNYFTKFCSQTIATAIFEPLGKLVGEPYKSYPLDSFHWAHGGIQGWGTACGTLIAAGFVTALIAGKKDGGNMANDIVYFYAENNAPTYKPAKAMKTDIQSRTVAGTPLCHVSVSRWMKKEKVGFFTPQRLERCARLSADVAMHTATLLNQWADGNYKPKHKLLSVIKSVGLPVGSSSHLGCTTCHSGGRPDVPGK